MFWTGSLAAVVMLTATQAFAGCTSQDLDVKINTERMNPTGLPGQAYFDFLTECAASAPAKVLQRARDGATSTGIYTRYQNYLADQQAAADAAAARRAAAEREAAAKLQQPLDREILKLERMCRTTGCDDDSEAIIQRYREQHPDLPPQSATGGTDLGGVDLGVKIKKVETPADLSDLRKQVLNLAR